MTTTQLPVLDPATREIIGTVPEAFEHPTLGRVGLHIMYQRL